MKVLVIGSNGQIGKQLVKLLQDSEEYQVRAMVRKEEQMESFAKDGVEAALADLEGSVDEIAAAAKDCEAIVFAAGSGGHTGLDKTLLVDLDGAVKSMEAAEKIGIKRFVIVSALQANNRENWNENIRAYYAAKHYADRMLVESDLNYTIIRPGGLLNETGTGKVSVGENLTRSSIPREDVARTIFAVLNEPKTHKRAFDVVSGDIAIEDAIKTL